jgi:vitamin B12 transporter
MTTPLVGLPTGKAHQGRLSARIPANAPSGEIHLFRHSLRGSGPGAIGFLDSMTTLHPFGLPALLGLFSGALVAQTPTLQPEVVVTATREQIPLNQAIADVTVIGPNEIQRNPARNLAELLAQQSGLEISMSGGLGATSSAFIRGTNSNHVLILIDGMRFGSATAGNPALENIPLGQIERIEIVRGPMSSLYGSDALGGVIQIFTKTGEGSGNRFTPNAQLSAGSQGFGKLATGFSGRQDAFDYSLQVQHAHSNGFSATNPKAVGFPPFGAYHPDAERFHQRAFSLNLGYRLNRDWALRFAAMNSQAHTEFDEGFDAANPKKSGVNKLEAQSLSLTLDGRLSPMWATKLSVGQSKDVSNTVDALNSDFIGAFATKQTQLAWVNRLTSAFGTWSIGLENLQQRVSWTDQIATPYFTPANFAPDQRSIQSVWLGWNLQQGDWQWQSSIRHDRNSQYGGKGTGNLGFAYRLSPAWRLHGSLASGFAAPSFNNLYYPGFGNPNLTPESSLSQEIGVRFNGNFGLGAQATSTGSAPPSEFKLVYFRQSIRDLIVIAPTLADPSVYAPANIETAKIQGLSAQFRHRAGAWMTQASLDLSNPVNDTSGMQQGNLLPRRARQNLRLSADYSVGAWQVGAGLKVAGSRYDDAANSVALPGYSVLDVRARMVVASDWSVGLNLNNLANKTYETAYGYNQAGRQVFVTLNYQPK